jgi:hypothetical protein
MNAFASPRHQRAAFRLMSALAGALAQRAELEVYGPAEWLLRADPVLARQPDVVVVPRRVADTGQARLTEPPCWPSRSSRRTASSGTS